MCTLYFKNFGFEIFGNWIFQKFWSKPFFFGIFTNLVVRISLCFSVVRTGGRNDMIASRLANRVERGVVDNSCTRNDDRGIHIFGRIE